jgi:hypothetical protein
MLGMANLDIGKFDPVFVQDLLPEDIAVEFPSLSSEDVGPAGVTPLELSLQLYAGRYEPDQRYLEFSNGANHPYVFFARMRMDRRFYRGPEQVLAYAALLSERNKRLNLFDMITEVAPEHITPIGRIIDKATNNYVENYKKVFQIK